MNVKWLSNLAHNITTNPTWFVGYLLVLLVISTIVPDIDHPLHYYLGWGDRGRFLHPYFAYIGLFLTCCGVGVLIALYRRLVGH